MDYKLFDEYITLQSLLKEIGIIQSGGSIKKFLADNRVLFNGDLENRRGKKLRLGDIITIPDQNIEIIIRKPSDQEIEERNIEIAEKQRVSAIVKEMNKNTNKGKSKTSKKPVRFPGT
ncbi:S4 domain-containing protein YaaA [Streptococcus agalactiae]|uniref:S4 domain-containing protein YaaA n=1 Tax=Streptococcus agalactiae TaxID=1311 RepID=UPI00123DFCD0|nr:S4 domain-containing protein YaaA [Streptococcus agalactiae]KAA8957533.1 S4 domain-containing protein YaaA [Streptococcus agalactiae]KAA8964040.1 S4 domain-containing protein YaaA [Streptococcus agalactiae]